MVDRASGWGTCSGESGLDERPGGDWRRLSCSKYRSRAAMKPRREYAAKDSEYSRSLFCLSCECAGMSIGYDAAYGEEGEFVDISFVLWTMVVEGGCIQRRNCRVAKSLASYMNLSC